MFYINIRVFCLAAAQAESCAWFKELANDNSHCYAEGLDFSHNLLSCNVDDHSDDSTDSVDGCQDPEWERGAEKKTMMLIL